ncbi:MULTISPECIES: hypothetical protein [Caballeronia]|uniref:Lipoprotein n=1 Tax=Caballeronia zhejiangensis TaxID=871203 RepID=A0A656QCY9_9BURK|nr:MULTISPECIES: hypothetical protein [Caballeronia]EKS71754.1 hypothetical protein BURK_007936 [Burkholderia sp. SJ98]KDR24830.1 hypothetical protein BG60_33860 [Caballeronia zhejiangensis]
MNRNSAVARRIGIGRACAIAGIAGLSCFSNVDARTITVLSGTYGANCGAPAGNATGDLARQCDGRDTCQYVPDRQSIGYTARSCSTDLQAEWRCTATEIHTAMLSPEAGTDGTLVLSCIEENGPGH